MTVVSVGFSIELVVDPGRRIGAKFDPQALAQLGEAQERFSGRVVLGRLLAKPRLEELPNDLGLGFPFRFGHELDVVFEVFGQENLGANHMCIIYHI